MSLHAYLRFPECERCFSRPLPGPDPSLPVASRRRQSPGTAAAMAPCSPAPCRDPGCLPLRGPAATAGLWFPISHIAKRPINSGAVEVIGFRVPRLNSPCPPRGPAESSRRCSPQDRCHPSAAAPRKPCLRRAATGLLSATITCPMSPA